MQKPLKLAYLILLHVLVVVLIFKTDTYIRFVHWLGKPPAIEESRAYQNAAQHQVRRQQTLEAHQTVFLGDSMIAGMNTAHVIPASLNFGIGGDTSKGLIKRLSLYPNLKNAQQIVIGIGINDLPYQSVDTIVQNILDMLRYFSHKQNIYVLGLLPVTKSHSENSQRSLQAIQAINKQLQTRLLKFGQTTYIEPPEALSDSTGYLREDAHLGDGLHLNQRGYALWQQHLKKVMDAL